MVDLLFKGGADESIGTTIGGILFRVAHVDGGLVPDEGKDVQDVKKVEELLRRARARQALQVFRVRRVRALNTPVCRR